MARKILVPAFQPCAGDAKNRLMATRQAAIRRDGLVLKDRYNQLRNHPAVTIEGDARSGFLLGMKALRLDTKPLGKPGGQPGSKLKSGAKR